MVAGGQWSVVGETVPAPSQRSGVEAEPGIRVPGCPGARRAPVVRSVAGDPAAETPS
jgi:hypothetical protein